MEKLKNPRATLQFQIKVGTPEWDHLIEAEKHLSKAGVSFDTGYACEEHMRDWELDWSLSGAKLANVYEMSEQEIKTKEKLEKKDLEEKKHDRQKRKEAEV